MRTRFLVAVGAGLLFLPTCSGASGSIRGLIETSPGWSRTDLSPVTQPAVVGDRVLLYVVSRHRLRVVALDARSGATVWSDQAFPSGVTNGVAPNLAVLDRKVIYVRGGYGFTPELVAADVRTGRRVWRRGLIVITTWPRVCHDEQTAVCVTGSLLAGRTGTRQLAFDGRDGKLRTTTLVSAGDEGREIGDGLFDPGRRHPEMLVATRRAKVTWRKPLARIFPLPGVSTDWGWSFDRIDRSSLFVGSVRAAPKQRTKSRVVLDLSQTMVAGFRTGDGSVLWRDRGTTYACGLLPCSGADMSSFSDPTAEGETGTKVGVRLRESGTLSASPTRPVVVPSPDARVSLEGFEPTTGHMQWQFDAGHDVGLITLRRLPPQVDSTTEVLRDSSGQLTAVDLADGARKPVSASDPAWCRAPILYRLRRIGLELYGGQFALYPCTAAGLRVKTPPTAAGFVGSIGGRARDLVVWSDIGSVDAVPVRR